MSDLSSKIEFEMNEALRVASQSANRPQAALYLCRVIRKAILADSTWNGGPHGLEWLNRNHTEFKRWVSDASPLFRSVIEEAQCVLKIIQDEDLLQLVAPESLEAFVREVLFKHRVTSFIWLARVHAAGLPVEKQVAIMMDTITAALQRRDDISYRYITDFFLSWNGDDFHKWDILSQEQFYDTLRRCAEVCPWGAVRDAEKLVPYMEARLTAEQCKSIFDILPGCGSWFHAKVENVAILPHAVQCRLVANALDVSAQILEHVATIPNGREAAAEYLKRANVSPEDGYHADTSSDQPVVSPGADALLQTLRAAPGRGISDVPVRRPAL